MRHLLCPGLDQTFTALIEDLDARGLLDETMVVCISEHGRTPQLVSNRIGGGRDHWSNVYSSIFAGGGFAKGRVVGRSDSLGGEVADNPVSPKDVIATMYHLLGIDPHTILTDRLGRPVPAAGDSVVRPELLE
jgi:arylsulfatase A-like enzyme